MSWTRTLGEVVLLKTLKAFSGPLCHTQAAAVPKRWLLEGISRWEQKRKNKIPHLATKFQGFQVSGTNWSLRILLWLSGCPGEETNLLSGLCHEVVLKSGHPSSPISSCHCVSQAHARCCLCFISNLCLPRCCDIKRSHPLVSGFGTLLAWKLRWHVGKWSLNWCQTYYMTTLCYKYKPRVQGVVAMYFRSHSIKPHVLRWFDQDLLISTQAPKCQEPTAVKSQQLNKQCLPLPTVGSTCTELNAHGILAHPQSRY